MDLYLFTASYPYGTRESFLEDEIRYVSSCFDTVHILPLGGNDSIKRNTPNNCVVYKPVLPKKSLRYLKLFVPSAFHTLYIKDFFSKKVFFSKFRIKTWLISFSQAVCLAKSNTIKKVFSKIQKNDVCYFYWGKGANVLSILYEGRAKFVSRFHGEWDLWEESSGNYAPIRQKIVSSLDMTILISTKGEKYLGNRYVVRNAVISPLGSEDYGLQEPNPQDGVLRVISCSTVYPLKRVDLIFRALNTLDNLKIDWTHIGTGCDFEQLKDLVNTECSSHLKVDLVGRLNHEDVMKYYKCHHFDVFINVSTNEGVPVSIMEAISFDIPIIATNVGGTSDVVRSTVGELLSQNPTTEEICSAIRKIMQKKYEPRIFWEKHYSASVNYNDLVDLLINL